MLDDYRLLRCRRADCLCRNNHNGRILACGDPADRTPCYKLHAPERLGASCGAWYAHGPSIYAPCKAAHNYAFTIKQRAGAPPVSPRGTISLECAWLPTAVSLGGSRNRRNRGNGEATGATEDNSRQIVPCEHGVASRSELNRLPGEMMAIPGDTTLIEAHRGHPGT